MTFTKEKPLKLAILLSNTGIDAEKILEMCRYQPHIMPVLMYSNRKDSRFEENYENFKTDFKFELLIKEISDFTEIENRRTRKEIQEAYLYGLFNDHKPNLIALTGFDLILPDFITDDFYIINLHHGDLRVKDKFGKHRFDGIDWEPCAKAIIAGKNKVYTSVYRVTTEGNFGEILNISEPEYVQKEALKMKKNDLLNGYRSIDEVIKHLRNNPSENKNFPIYHYAKDCQERLKINADSIIYPRTILSIAENKIQLK
jgi:folate-dependent phosphoribosylglycinamide formyltransferase PurN